MKIISEEMERKMDEAPMGEAITKACMDEHLEHEVVPNPLTELAILEAKQRHPSRRGLR